MASAWGAAGNCGGKPAFFQTTVLPSDRFGATMTGGKIIDIKADMDSQ
jgi:hypothetical protein